jgi:methylphosphotriester-DNA--protein-cysteine methyltransferase
LPPQLTKADGPGLPGINAATLTDSKEYSEVVKTLLQIIRERENGRALKIICSAMVLTPFHM